MNSNLSQPMQTSNAQHAIVIGGSIAGLTLARILTDYFARVTIVERDHLPETPAFRKGVPHARHAHILLARGQMILEELFPGLSQELLAGGAVNVNTGSEYVFFVQNAWSQRYQSALNQIGCSRALLEHTIYRRVAAHPKVQFLQEHEALGLCTDANGTRVTGLRVRDRREGALPETVLHADLVLDASGRDSHAPQWLTSLGYTAPEEVCINPFPGYASRIYQRPAHFKETWKGLYVMPAAPAQTRGGVILPMEGNRWQVTIAGLAKDYPPTDEAGFLEFARNMPSPALYEAIKGAEPLAAPYGYRKAENRRRYYEKLPRYLEGFLVGGDAVYAFNPVYAQGMSVAAIGSQILGACLQEQRQRHANGDLTGLAKNFQQKLAQVIEGPWQMATSQDLRYATTEGGKAPDAITKLIQGYMDQVLRTMPRNPAVAEAFFHVQHMLKPPTSLFHPRLLWQVLGPQWRRSPLNTIARRETQAPSAVSGD